MAKAVDRIRPQLRKQGCEVELLGVNEARSGCEWKPDRIPAGRPRRRSRQLWKDAIYDAAPDMTSLIIEGFEEKPASGFVALERTEWSRPLKIHPVTLEPQGAD